MQKLENLWEKVGNACLRKAAALLESEATPTAGTVSVVRELVETAIAIDSLNLHWAKSGVFSDRLSSRKEGEN